MYFCIGFLSVESSLFKHYLFSNDGFLHSCEVTDLLEFTHSNTMVIKEYGRRHLQIK